MAGSRHSRLLKTDSNEQGRPLSAVEREKLLRPYLPSVPKPSPAKSSEHAGTRSHHKQRVRPAIRHLIHTLLFTILHTLFGIYIRLRQAYHAIYDRLSAILYYHHRTPDLIRRDVRNLRNLPKHLSVILELPPEGGNKDRLEMLVNDACEVAAWTASAGIPMLSIYERSGILKHALPHLYRRITRTLTSYYGATSPTKPILSIRAPHMPSYSPPDSPTPSADGVSKDHPLLTILLIDESDGRQTLVDLTKTLAEMSQHGKIMPSDISSELIDAEISESVMGEPDLLILFGERVVLNGYPPWQARLTEIFHVPDHTGGVGYHVFLRALYKYAKAEMRLGR